MNRKWDGKRPKGFREYEPSPFARLRDYLSGSRGSKYFMSWDEKHILRIVPLPDGYCDVVHQSRGNPYPISRQREELDRHFIFYPGEDGGVVRPSAVGFY